MAARQLGRAGSRASRGAPGPGRADRGTSRYSSAGQIIGVTLACFGLWTFFDARQLYESAVASPHLGVRRSVSMDLLGPVARVEEALSADRLVNGLNRLISRSANGPGGGGAVIPVVPPVTTVAPRSGSSPGGRTGTGSTTPTTVATPTSTSAPAPVALAQPSAAHPLKILVIGDSIGEDLQIGLTAVIGTNPTVRIYPDAVGDTGLANVAYYNWPSNLRREVASIHPDLVLAMFGGNDWQPFLVGGRIATPGTAFWHAEYGAVVAGLDDEATSTGARVVWVGLPAMGPASGLPPEMSPTLDGIYAAEIATHPGSFFLSTRRLFSTGNGAYAEYLTIAGNVVQVRDPDGVHIDPPGGTNLLGEAVVHLIEAKYRIHL